MTTSPATSRTEGAKFFAAEVARRVLVPLQLLCAGITAGVTGRVARLCGDTMGTTWTVQYVVPAGESGVAAIDLQRNQDEATEATIRAVLDSVIAGMSNWRGDSDISRFNCAPAGSWVTLSDACFDVVETALKVARLTGGAFDPCAGPLINLWGFGPAGRREHAPSAAEVEAIRRYCGWSRIELDRSTLRVRQPGHASLDLCAIAKGYAVDAVSEALTHVGIGHHLVEIGGELRGEGVKPDGMPWWVEIETPLHVDVLHDSRNTLPTHDLIALHGLSVATSGDYRRYFVDRDAQRQYAHTIDPRTGYPANHALASVTVVHRECMLADALSTALMVLGPDAGMALAHRERIAARCVTRTADGFGETVSPAYAAMLE
ncbi:thiamine biosynthesis lipoprotein [Paraburkholderia sp. GAS333]